MMNFEGKDQLTYPEQGPLRPGYPVEEVLAAFRYSRKSETDSNNEEAEGYIGGLERLFLEGLPAYPWDNFRAVAQLPLAQGEASDFWVQESIKQAIKGLKKEALNDYIDITAETINYYAGFLETNPALIKLGLTGPHIVGLEAEFNSYNESDPPLDPPTSLIAYTSTGEAVLVDTPAKLFIDSNGLTAEQLTIVNNYYQDFEIKPFNMS